MLTVGSRIPCGLKTSVFHSLEKELIPVADTLDLSKAKQTLLTGIHFPTHIRPHTLDLLSVVVDGVGGKIAVDSC